MFTSIPIEEAIDVTKKKLTTDSSWKEKTSLKKEDILQLLELCLTTTYFTYNQEIYKQKQGTAMGSPVSPVIANLFMEDFEDLAINTFVRPPEIWFRYVDDTITVLHEYDIDQFFSHLNSINPSIQFTIEQEKDNKIAFLDTLLHKKDDGTLKTTVYRKPTHTDLYLNFHSNHHLEHKRSVVRTLMHRAQQLNTEDEDLQKEIAHIRGALTANEYRPWMMNLPQKTPPPQDKDTPGNNQNHHKPLGIPYIQGKSEELSRSFKKFGINIYHKPFNTLRSQLLHPKDKTDKLKKCGVIYLVTCNTCKKEYIGETGRPLGKRLEEHRKITSSAINEHINTTGHQINWEEVKILASESNTSRRKIKEAIYIHRHKPALNRDQGLDLSAVYLPLVSHDPRWSCD